MFRLITFFVLLLTAVIPSSVAADYFADNGFGKPISNMQHPCAECYHGVTYIAYQGPGEDPYVCAYDHVKAQWTGPLKAGISELGKAVEAADPEEADNHGRPALLVDGQGYIHVIFGGHGGKAMLGSNDLGTPGGGNQIHVVSKRPGDITEWEVLDNITPFGTYSQFVKMPGGDIYLFYRHGSHQSDWVYQKSTDNCRTFAPPVSILKHKPQAADPNVHDAWYARFNEGKGNTITATFNYHPCAVIGHQKTRSNCYYMKMNCADGSWENVQGEPLALPVTKESADAHALVEEGGMRLGICRADEDGNPHLFFRQGTVRYRRWTGSEWQAQVIVAPDPKNQDGDFLINSPKEIRMFLAERVGDKGEVGVWRTNNGGLQWEKESSLISSDSADFIVGVLVRNAHPDARVVVSEITPKQDSPGRKMYLFGDHGPVKRE